MTTQTIPLQLTLNISEKRYDILANDVHLEDVVSSFLANYVEDLQDRKTKIILNKDKKAIFLTEKLKNIA